MQIWQSRFCACSSHMCAFLATPCGHVVARLAIAPYRDLVARIRDRDACPGALQLHQAADGALARVRLPGGMISAEQLEALAHAATRFGSPAMELTSRGNIQLRAITDTAAVAEIVAAAGLLPSQTHERVRNIVASPLSGRVGGTTDIRGLVTELDEAIQSEPALARAAGQVHVRRRRRPRRHLGTRRRCGRTLSRRGDGRPAAGGPRYRRAAEERPTSCPRSSPSPRGSPPHAERLGG